MSDKPIDSDEGARLHEICMGAPLLTSADYVTRAQARWGKRATEFSRPYRERIAELEKQLATLNDWAVICGGKTPTVDGKTPGLAYLEGYKQEYARTMQYKPEDMDDCVALWRDMPSDDKREMEAGAVNVLRVFGPALTRQAAVDTLGRVRERIETDGLRIFEGERYGIDAIGCAVAMIDAEISAFESPKLASNHVHELGSCSLCGRSTPL